MYESLSNPWRTRDTLSSGRHDNTLAATPSSLAHYIHQLREAHARGGMQAIEQVLRTSRLPRALVEPYALL
ncbi:MAG TPA: hypothetical protein VF664_21000, partial [Cystobacter sp.]